MNKTAKRRGKLNLQEIICSHDTKYRLEQKDIAVNCQKYCIHLYNYKGKKEEIAGGLYTQFAFIAQNDVCSEKL